MAVLPFEARGPGLGLRVWRTLRAFLDDPPGAWAALGEGRSLAAPWRLKLLFAAPLYLGAALGLALLQIMLLAAAWAHPNPLPRGAAWVLPGALAALLVAGPLLQFAAMVLGGVLLHGLLWAFRGTRQGAGLRQTLRAAGYTQAFVGLLGLAPPLGLVAHPAAKLLLGRGLARLHKTEPWRGLAAAIIQGLLTVLVAAALVGGLAFYLVRMDQRSRQINLPTPDLTLPPPPVHPDLV